VRAVSNDVISELDSRANCLLSLIPAFHASNQSQSMGNLESAYTMETERHIHESLSQEHSSPQEIDGKAARNNSAEHPFSKASHDAGSAESGDDAVSPHACSQAHKQESDVPDDATEFGENVELF
jgi:hypothetical protein